MTYLAAILAAAFAALLGLYLGRKAHPESCRASFRGWVESEDGVQGVDPYVVGLWKR